MVDNSPDISGKKIVEEVFPHVNWHFMGYNAGFARANNVGVDLSRGEICLLLNSDTLVLNDAIQGCFESFVSSEYIACGVQLLNTDGSPQISGNYFMPGSINNLLPLPVIGSLLKFGGNLLGVKKPHIPDSNSVQKVDWINGAFLMVKKKVLAISGQLDPDFFLYAEEAEWCSRLSKIGPLCIFGQYKVIHLQGESANKTFSTEGKGYYDLYSKKGLQILLSNMVRIRKQFGVLWLLFHVFLHVVEIFLFLLLAFFRSLFLLRNPIKEFRNPVLFFLNVVRLIGYLPPLIAHRPFFYKVL